MKACDSTSSIVLLFYTLKIDKQVLFCTFCTENVTFIIQVRSLLSSSFVRAPHMNDVSLPWSQLVCFCLISSHIFSCSGDLCDSDITALKDWRLTLKVEDGSQLTKSGKEEQLEMGRRFRKRFPGLLDQEYSQSKFQVLLLKRSLH